MYSVASYLLYAVVDQLPRLGKRELVFLLLFTCSFVVSVFGRLLFLLVLGMGWAFLLWHSLGLLLIIYFDFDIVTFPFLDSGVPRRPSYGVYISLIFATVCCHVDVFNARNKCLIDKLLKQGYRYHKLRNASSKFYHRHKEFVSKFITLTSRPIGT